jgi:hypothetical protein
LNCLQHRLEQAAFLVAAAVVIAAKSVVARRKTVVAEGLIARAGIRSPYPGKIESSSGWRARLADQAMIAPLLPSVAEAGHG